MINNKEWKKGLNLGLEKNEWWDMSLKCVANVIDKKSVFPIEVKCEKFTI